MKLLTIWTLPACSLVEKLRRTRDWAAQKAAMALPLRIRYFVTIQMISKAVSGSRDAIPDIPLSTILEHLETPKGQA